MTFDSLTNRAEFFSDHYLEARLATDLNELRQAWDTAEGRGQPTARTGLRSLGREAKLQRGRGHFRIRQA